MNLNWDEIKLGIRGEMPENSYHLWIKPLRVIEQEDDRIVLGCPNGFARDWVLTHYLAYLKQKFQEVGIKEPRIQLEVLGTNLPGEEKNHGLSKTNRKMLPNPLPYDSHYTFDNFVVGLSNQFAFSASKAIAEMSAMDYKILLMLSYPGLGKTHLTKAILNRVHELRPDLRVCYVTAEEFTSQMIRSIKQNRVEEFKDRFRRDCDILLMEELHFLGGKQKTQSELGYTMDRLINDRKTIVITSCLAPKDIPNLNVELSSRLSLSLMASIDRPDFETRYKIVEVKATELGIKIGKDIITKIASSIKNDMRNIECILKYVKAKSEFLNVKVSPCLVDEVLEKLTSEAESISPSKIQDTVCKYFRVTFEEMKSKSKRKNLVLSRNVFAYLCRKHSSLSIKEISNKINRTHSTILHGIECLEREMQRDEALKHQIGFVEERLTTA